MAGIDRKTVEHLASLARIELTEQELQTLEKDLSSILTYVDELKQVNTDGLPEVAQVTGLKNILREDVSKENQSIARADILKAAPATENDMVKVKSVFK